MPAIRAIISEQTLPGLPFDDDSELRGDLHFDALHIMTVACEAEEAFGIDLPDAVVEGWQTVGDVRASVEGRRHAA